MTSVRLSFENSLDARAEQIFTSDLLNVQRRTSRLFAVLLVFEWLAVIAAALVFSPFSWDGAERSIHIHLYAAVLFGGILTIFPAYLALVRPESQITHLMVSASQVLFSALLIHLTGGRIETHFHVFGSLAFVACFRDWRPLMAATVIVAADHFLRGVFWPQSVYGVSSVAVWRSVEHAAWVIFEDGFLLRSIFMQRREMLLTAFREAKLEATYTDVERQVKERTAELEHAKCELEVARDRALASVEAKGRFLANMSHELRTPLNAIVGFSDLLASDRSLSDEHREQLQIVHSSAGHLLAIVNDILDFSKIEAGKMTIHPVITDIRDIMENIVRAFDAQTQEKAIEMALSIAPEVPEQGLIDPVRFRQVMTNLISNAIKFTESGGGVIVMLGPGLDDGETMTLSGSISDSGVGIAADRRTQIFEPFEQADGSHTRLYGGTGLGLSITSELLAAMNGSIRVESIPGVGTRFQFAIQIGKVNERLKSAAHQQVAGLSGVQQPLSILVAEDNPVNQRLIQVLLTKRGHSVTMANNGVEAIEFVRQGTFDLILMDIQMPVLDGQAAFHEIRNLQNLNGSGLTPVIAVTAHAMAGDMENYLSQGMDGYITKPIDSRELERELARLTQRQVN